MKYQFEFETITDKEFQMRMAKYYNDMDNYETKI